MGLHYFEARQKADIATETDGGEMEGKPERAGARVRACALV